MLFSSRRSVPPSVLTDAERQTETRSISDVVGLAHLWTAQFQQIMNLALAGAGGLLVLLQTELVPISGRWWVALVSFILAALVSLIGQMYVVDEAMNGRIEGRGARAMVALASVFFGGSLYLLVRIFLEAPR